MTEKVDDIYSERLERVGNFVFDDKVAAVFDDMINRSVPGYASIISSIGLLARESVTVGSRCYDLGCSLGAATLEIRRSVSHSDYTIVAVDSAPAMVEACKKKVALDQSEVAVEVVCDDVCNVELRDASLVVLNFTLQFIEPDARDELVKRVYRAMMPGGILLLSEKLAFEDPQIASLLADMHLQFKRANGYSELEISQKRNALEKVLIPETLDAHKTRLRLAGFSSFELWFQCFNFASLVAVK
ncbi:MAG: carboxy-S-adenosyl-L-methionine synthase CmoA [Pseudomonadota bacterium]